MSLRKTAYSVETTLETAKALPVEEGVRSDLVAPLRTGVFQKWNPAKDGLLSHRYGPWFIPEERTK